MADFVPDGFVSLLEAVERVAATISRAEPSPNDSPKDEALRNAAKEKAAHRLRQALAAGKVSSQLLTEGAAPLHKSDGAGQLLQIPAKFWVSAQGGGAFAESGRVFRLYWPYADGHGSWFFGRVLIHEDHLAAFLVGEPASIPTTADYVPPYIAFMLRAVPALGLSPEKRITTAQIKHWLRQNWSSHLGPCSENKLDMMGTFLRTPEQAKGGNSSWRDKPRPVEKSGKRPRR